ncbi:MAG: hypothetical protein ABI569_03275 [Casimicrobiaceae bacterium]
MTKNLKLYGRTISLALLPLSAATPAFAADFAGTFSLQDDLLAGLIVLLVLALSLRLVRRTPVVEPTIAAPDLRSWKNPQPA